MRNSNRGAFERGSRRLFVRLDSAGAYFENYANRVQSRMRGKGGGAETGISSRASPAAFARPRYTCCRLSRTPPPRWETGRRGDGETGSRGDGETGRRGDGETGRRTRTKRMDWEERHRLRPELRSASAKRQRAVRTSKAGGDHGHERGWRICWRKMLHVIIAAPILTNPTGKVFQKSLGPRTVEPGRGDYLEIGSVRPKIRR
jgi:hypothetical protein